MLTKSEKNKEWYKQHPSKMKEYGYKYWIKNKEIIKKRNKTYRQKNIDKILHWAKMRKAEGSHTLKQWEKLLKETNGICPSCRQFVGFNKITRDHIIPIFLGGTNDIENIQPLCGPCNSSKGIDIIKVSIIKL